MSADRVVAPFDDCRDVLRPEWIDRNQHINMGYYLLASTSPPIGSWTGSGSTAVTGASTR